MREERHLSFHIFYIWSAEVFKAYIFYSVPIACFTMIGDNKRSHMLLTDLNIFLIREY